MLTHTWFEISPIHKQLNKGQQHTVIYKSECVGHILNESNLRWSLNNLLYLDNIVMTKRAYLSMRVETFERKWSSLLKSAVCNLKHENQTDTTLLPVEVRASPITSTLSVHHFLFVPKNSSSDPLNFFLGCFLFTLYTKHYLDRKVNG